MTGDADFRLVTSDEKIFVRETCQRLRDAVEMAYPSLTTHAWAFGETQSEIANMTSHHWAHQISAPINLATYDVLDSLDKNPSKAMADFWKLIDRLNAVMVKNDLSDKGSMRHWFQAGRESIVSLPEKKRAEATDAINRIESGFTSIQQQVADALSKKSSFISSGLNR